MQDGTRVAAVDPEHAERVVRSYFEKLGDVEHKEAYTHSEVSGILIGLGYHCFPGTIAEFVRKGYIADPGETLDCVAIYCLTCALESRRRWLPTPCPNDIRKTGVRLAIEKLQAEGVEQPISDIDAHTVEDLLLQMCQCNNQGIRESFYETLKLKLAGYEE